MKPALAAKPPKASKSSKLSKAEPADPLVAEIVTLAGDVTRHLRQSCHGAILIGLRLIVLHRETAGGDDGGFRAALDALAGCQIPRATAYRWLNAAGTLVARLQGIEAEDAQDLALPTAGTREWKALEGEIEAACHGMSIRRLMLGSAATSDESRLDNLITEAEAGDKAAEEMLDRVAKGELTLVQAIRAAAGAAATKNKQRLDPVYLDIDGRTGEPRGLFVKSLVTLTNTFARWDHLPEAAREKARAAWKEAVAKLPKDLR